MLRVTNHLGRSHARRLRRLHEVLAEAALVLGRSEDPDDRALAGLVAQVSSLSEAIRTLLVDGWGGPAIALCRVQFEAVEWIVHLTEPVPKVTAEDLRARIRVRTAALIEHLDDPRFPLDSEQRERLRAHRALRIDAPEDPTRHGLPAIGDVESRARSMQRRLVFLRELLLRPTGGLDLGGACGTSDDLEDPGRAIVEASRWGFAEAITASRANGLLALRALARHGSLTSLKGAVRGPKKNRAQQMRLAHERPVADAPPPDEGPRNEETATPPPEESDVEAAVPVEV